jgi:hypothetical protein
MRIAGQGLPLDETVLHFSHFLTMDCVSVNRFGDPVVQLRKMTGFPFCLSGSESRESIPTVIALVLILNTAHNAMQRTIAWAIAGFDVSSVENMQNAVAEFKHLQTQFSSQTAE